MKEIISQLISSGLLIQLIESIQAVVTSGLPVVVGGLLGWGGISRAHRLSLEKEKGEARKKELRTAIDLLESSELDLSTVCAEFYRSTYNSVDFLHSDYPDQLESLAKRLVPAISEVNKAYTRFGLVGCDRCAQSTREIRMEMQEVYKIFAYLNIDGKPVDFDKARYESALMKMTSEISSMISDVIEEAGTEYWRI